MRRVVPALVPHLLILASASCSESQGTGLQPGDAGRLDRGAGLRDAGGGGSGDLGLPDALPGDVDADPCRDASCPDLGPADVGPGDAAGPDARMADSGVDAGACANDGLLTLSYEEAFPGGLSADCQPAVPDDPTRLSLDFLRLSNWTRQDVRSLSLREARVVETTTGVSVQRVTLSLFVPLPDDLLAGEEWISLATKTAGEPVGAAVCQGCGRDVSLVLTFDSAFGCFRETVPIGAFQCVF